MAKKLGKFLLGVTVIGAAVAGIVYLVKDRSDCDMDDIFSDDMDDDDFELDDDLDAVSSDREYVSLNPAAAPDAASEEVSEDSETETAAAE